MIGRILVLTAALVLASPPMASSWTPLVAPALSPFAGIGSAIARRSLDLVTLLCVPVLLLALLSPRWFCRFGCPVGLLQELVNRFGTRDPGRLPRLPSIGRWLVLLTVGGAVLGYPLFLWLDPLALMNAFLNAWRRPLSAATMAAGSSLVVVLLLALISPRLWCLRLCPLGATQDLLALSRRPVRPTPENRDCGSTGSWRSLASVGARRSFLFLCAGSAVGLAIRSVQARTSRPLRPPGSIPEEQFSGVCIRCGNCARACPPGIIEPDMEAGRPDSLLTPILRFEHDYCREDCRSCQAVCPSGALARLSLSAKRAHAIGTAQIDVESCLLANGRECTSCIRSCPFGALSVVSTDGGFSTYPQVDPVKCNGCGACETICPVRPARAAKVLPRLGARAILFLTSCLGLLATTSLAAELPFVTPRCELVPLPGRQVSFQLNGEEKTCWHFGDDYPRPFFYPFKGPSGSALTRMGHPGAQSHDHHQSIWFAHEKVDGVDFWSDRSAARIRYKSWYSYEDGNEEAVMACLFGWHDGTGREIMEQETIAAMIPGDGAEYGLELQINLRPPAGKATVLLGKTNFGFLAVRVAKTVSEHFGGGRLRNSEGQEHEEEVFGKPARWVDYSGPVPAGQGLERRTVVEGITYFDHPRNPRYPARWHVREDGWMGASFCMQEGFDIPAGAPLTLRYLLYSHRGSYDQAKAEAIHTAFSRRPRFLIRKSTEKHRQYEVVRESTSR